MDMFNNDKMFSAYLTKHMQELNMNSLTYQ